MSMLKRKAEDLQELRDITDDIDESAFMPYSCHVDPETILTKNGELLQTVKIVGFSYEDISKPYIDLRESIRNALQESIETADYAIWLHTIRRKASLTPAGEYPDDFSALMNAAWRKHKDWEHKYVNEVYITIVKEGQYIPVARPDEFFRGLIPQLDRRFRWKYLKRALESLTETTDVILASLESFGARRLSLIERDGVIVSEPVSFLHKLATLTDKPLPLPQSSLADYLTTHDVTFGFNAMEVRTVDGKRRFGAILTVKDYREMPSSSIDLLVQTEAEFIITQTMDFINQKDALAVYKEQQDIFSISQAAEMAEQIGLNEIITTDNKKAAINFGEQQINLFVLGDSVRELEQNVRKMVRGLSGLGIIAIREDIKFEETYWAQLPANFEFLRRLKPISLTQLGGFATINNLPAGLLSGSRWGPPVSVFYTAARTPYFFNFHVDRNGHTVIVGPYNAGKTVLMNFLLSEARKFKSRLFFFDRNRNSEIFMRSLGAQYYHIDYRDLREKSDLSQAEGLHRLPKLNPFSLEDTPQNRSFLLVWLDACLQADRFYRPEMSEEFWPFFQTALEHVLALPKEQRSLNAVIEYLKDHAPQVAAKMYDWYKDAKYARWFNNTEDTLDLSRGLVGLELGPLMEDKRAAPAVVAYLIQRVMLTLDGTPTILVLDEAWELLDNPVFASRLGGWLEMLRSRNTMVVMATERAEDVIASPLSATVMQQVATQIYLPNPGVNTEDYERIFGLTAKESETITRMQRQQRQFLLKRGRVSIVAELDLTGLIEYIAVLSSRSADLNIMEKMIVTHGDKHPMDWLPAFMEEVKKAS